MIDSQPPRRPPHNRNRGGQAPKARQVRDIEVRFVYENELKGSWFPLAEAVTRNLPVLPHPGHRVIRIEFRDRADL